MRTSPGGARRYGSEAPAAPTLDTAKLASPRRRTMASDTWSIIHAERAALVADLGSLTDQQWATPSLCGGWTVRDVLGHMVATAKKTPPTFFAGLASAGFRFNTMTAK